MRRDTVETDAALFLAATALQLRRRPELKDRNERSVFSAIGLLLEALASALARDRSSVPEPVRDAAMRLARRLHLETAPHPARTGSHMHSGRGRSRQSDRVPVTDSIALGRMG
jgi:hypothetical protein